MSSLHEASIPICRRGLGGLRTVLDKAHQQSGGRDEARLLSLSVADRLNSASSHVHSACNRAAADIRRVIGEVAPGLPKPAATFSALGACIANAEAVLAGIDPATLDQAACEIVSFGSREKGTLRQMTGHEFILTNSLPQFFFHLTNVYVTLRYAGIALSKPDFLDAV